MTIVWLRGSSAMNPGADPPWGTGVSCAAGAATVGLVAAAPGVASAGFVDAAAGLSGGLVGMETACSWQPTTHAANPVHAPVMMKRLRSIRRIPMEPLLPGRFSVYERATVCTKP